jgi:hypothetical protein
MPSQIAALADAVKLALNTAVPGTFSQAFTATRKYVPGIALKDMGTTLFVTVSPKSVDVENLTRTRKQKTVEIDVGIQKRLTPACNPTAEAGNAEIDPLMQFVEEVVNFFNPARTPIASANFVRVSNDPAFTIEGLDQERTFTSLITVTFIFN